MEGSSSAKLPPTPWEKSANQRLKENWDARVSWATVLAVVVHVALFVSWPDQARQGMESEPQSEPLQLEWITIRQSSPAQQAQAPLGLPVLDELDSLQVDDHRIGAPEGEGERYASLDEVFENRLLSSSAPRPTLAEPEEQSEASDGSANGPSDEADRFAGDAATAELPDWLGATPMDLDRLSEVRPEMAVVAPSSWVLIRNPQEVEAFIAGSYRRGELDRSWNGSVSVALWIDGRGRVEWAEISQSSGRDDMDEVALTLFSEVALFRPARNDGAPAPRSVVFSLQFPWMSTF